jgi:hypothetical protein
MSDPPPYVIQRYAPAPHRVLPTYQAVLRFETLEAAVDCFAGAHPNTIKVELKAWNGPGKGYRVIETRGPGRAPGRKGRPRRRH